MWIEAAREMHHVDIVILERIVEVGLDQYFEVVGEISSTVSKEVALSRYHIYTWLRV